MNIERISDIIGSFIDGFGNKSRLDINNAVFIAMEIQSLDLPLDFEEAGRLGVESTRLYGILRIAKPKKKHRTAFSIGEKFSDFNSRELMLMALYLWDGGKQSLSEKEREKALSLLEERFNIASKEKRITEPSSAVVSG